MHETAGRRGPRVAPAAMAGTCRHDGRGGLPRPGEQPPRQGFPAADRGAKKARRLREGPLLAGGRGDVRLREGGEHLLLPDEGRLNLYRGDPLQPLAGVLGPKRAGRSPVDACRRPARTESRGGGRRPGGQKGLHPPASGARGPRGGPGGRGAPCAAESRRGTLLPGGTYGEERVPEGRGRTRLRPAGPPEGRERVPGRPERPREGDRGPGRGGGGDRGGRLRGARRTRRRGACAPDEGAEERT